MIPLDNLEASPGVGMSVGDGVVISVGDGVGISVGEGEGASVGDGVGMSVGDGVSATAVRQMIVYERQPGGRVRVSNTAWVRYMRR